MKRQEKEAAVERLRTDLGEKGHLVLAEYRGLTVEQITALRTKVRGVAGSVKVMKNTLVRRAFEGTDKDVLEDLLSGPNALVYTTEDPVPVVKAIAEAAKEYEAVSIKGGVVEGRRVSTEEILRIVELPSREVLLGKALGSMAAPMQGMVNVLQGVTRNFVGVLNALRQARETGS